MRHKGYTLVELLLYITVISVLLLGASTFFTLSLSTRVKNQGITEVNQQGLAAMQYITQTVRNATSISSPATGGTAASLTVTVPTGALSPTIFNLSGTTLQVQEGAAAAIALTNNKVQMSNITFKNLSRSSSAEIVQVSFTVSYANTSGRSEYNYQKTFTSSVVLR